MFVRFADLSMTWGAAMSYVVAIPDALVAAASDLAGIGSMLSAANAAAAASTTSLMRAAVGDIVAADAQDIPRRLLQECAAIAAANGFPPRQSASEAGLAILTAPGSTFTASMLRDIEQGSRVEADHIVGDLLRRASKAPPSPLLATAYAHLRAYEARRRRESFFRRCSTRCRI